MPIAQASTSKETLRNAMLGADRKPRTTTSAGAAAGTTVIDSAATEQVDFYRGKWLLLTSGGSTRQFSQITDHAPATGTMTVAPAFSAQVATSVTYEVISIRPDLATIAANRALPKLYPWVAKPEIDYLLAKSDRDHYRVPRGIVDVWRVGIEHLGSEQVDDKFDRADSTTDPGSGWTETTGNWGVISERLYSVDDANADFLTRDPDLKNGDIQAIVRGTLNSATVYRSPALVFRIAEDRNGDIDTNNYLLVRLLNGVVDLRKVDGGTESSLDTESITTSDGVDYLLRIRYQGNLVRVWVDDVERITYELQGLNRKYSEYPRVGIRWNLAGAPATAARVDDYRAHSIEPFEEHHDWEQSYDKAELRFGLVGKRSGLYDDRWLRVEGAAPLQLLTADTYTNAFGTLDSDTTNRLEIETTDPAWELVVAACRAELYELAQDPAWNQNLESVAVYAELAARERERAVLLRRSHRMARPTMSAMYPY